MENLLLLQDEWKYIIENADMSGFNIYLEVTFPIIIYIQNIFVDKDLLNISNVPYTMLGEKKLEEE